MFPPLELLGEGNDLRRNDKNLKRRENEKTTFGDHVGGHRHFPGRRRYVYVTVDSPAGRHQLRGHLDREYLPSDSRT